MTGANLIENIHIDFISAFFKYLSLIIFNQALLGIWLRIFCIQFKICNYINMYGINQGSTLSTC
ncbi:hypothetical protein Avbf_01087 [Armadillidium vulgare]|nr:hypothetical protein Avbf_01087 [Armadillidium vulgare]